jgi:4-amino-4-deoxy-L-arabinose transferase-like glycosyltransferase
MSIKPYKWAALLLAIAVVPLFAHLDEAPLCPWDESRLAVSALEMLQNHNWLVPKFAGSPDMYSTKPPLMIWLQAGLMKTIGIGELAVRLPSAIAALLTCFLLFYFFLKKFNAPLFGVICGSVLLTCEGYVNGHGTRTGDYDALLTLLTTGYGLSFFLFLEGGERKYLVWTFVLLVLAVYTKSAQGLLLLPALFVYTIYKKKAKAILTSGTFYKGIGVSLLIVCSYYVIREQYNHGYIRTVLAVELLGRYNGVLDGHTAGAGYYIDRLRRDFFSEWYLLVVPGMITGFCSRNRLIKDVTVYSSLLVVSYLAIISGAMTKLEWYPMPVYPFLCALVGIFLFQAYDTLRGLPTFARGPQRIVPGLLLTAVFIIPYQRMALKVLTTPPCPWDVGEERDLALYLKDIIHHPEHNSRRCYLLNGPQGQNFIWYYEAIAMLRRPINFINKDHIVPRTMVVTYGQDSKAYLEAHFNAVVVYQQSSLSFYQVNDLKTSAR